MSRVIDQEEDEWVCVGDDVYVRFTEDGCDICADDPDDPMDLITLDQKTLKNFLWLIDKHKK